MPISLLKLKEEEEHILKVLPILLKKDEQFRSSLYTVLGETFIKKDDFSELKEIVKNLGIRVNELAQAQKKTEEELRSLSEEVRSLSEEVRSLTRSHKDLAEQVGGLSHTVGYTLENEAYKALPKLLEREFGLSVKDRLKREYVVDKKGNYIEINIVGEASKNGGRVTIIGEGKAQLSKNRVDEFIKKKLKRVEGVFGKIFPVLVTHMISSPDVPEYAKKRGITIYYSYDF